MQFRVIALVGIGIWLGGVFDRAAGQSLPRDLKEWTLDYGINGGIAGIIRHVTVASDGSVIVEDKSAADRLAGRAPDDLIAKIAATLKVARDERPSAGKRPAIPDEMGRWLSVTIGGREYGLEITPEIADLMDDAGSFAEKEAVVGTWSQSGWKLCMPAAQLAASTWTRRSRRSCSNPTGRSR